MKKKEIDFYLINFNLSCIKSKCCCHMATKTCTLDFRFLLKLKSLHILREIYSSKLKSKQNLSKENKFLQRLISKRQLAWQFMEDIKIIKYVSEVVLTPLQTMLWYEHEPENVVENENFKILWDITIQCNQILWQQMK